MNELDREIAGLSKKLADLRANAPKPPTDNIGLLDHLPLVEVDLNELAADRLRRFLEAFRVQIHYDVRTRRAGRTRASHGPASVPPAQVAGVLRPSEDRVRHRRPPITRTSQRPPHRRPPREPRRPVRRRHADASRRPYLTRVPQGGYTLSTRVKG